MDPRSFTSRSLNARGAVLAALALSGAPGGCAAPESKPAGAPRAAEATVVAPPGRAARPEATGLVAIVDGRPIAFDSLRAALVERAGGEILLDAVVDARLAERLRRAGVEVDRVRIEREREVLLDALSDDRARALELLRGIRDRQGLGDTRFESLLARNAGLRALVEREVAIDERGLLDAHDVRHGARRTVRIAVLPTLSDAERFIADLPSRDFATLAVERSRDESAARGGLLAPFARRDPSYPEALRAAAFATDAGAVSAPVVDGARVFIVRVESEAPADGVTPEASREECMRALRLARERLLMDALARELASMDGVTVFDRAFDRAID